jgi:hypothetical protein
MVLACPRCQSSNTQRTAVVYLGGVSTGPSLTDTAGGGISPGGVAVGGAASATQGFQQTELSKRLAPPVDRPLGMSKTAAIVLGAPLCLLAWWAAVSDWPAVGVALVLIVVVIYLLGKSNEQRRAIAESNEKSRRVGIRVLLSFLRLGIHTRARSECLTTAWIG